MKFTEGKTGSRSTSGSLILMIILPLLFIHCSDRQERSIEFMPDTLDGVTFFGFNDHSMEDRFHGDWGAPTSGADKRFFRKLEKGKGRISFFAVDSEKYIFNSDYTSTSGEIEFDLNGQHLSQSGQNKFVKKELINRGVNVIEYNAAAGLRFKESILFPSRISRIRDFKDIIIDQTVLFLPGTLRYYIKPLQDESLHLTLGLNGRETIKADIEIITDSDSSKTTLRFSDKRSTEIPIIKGKYQEIRITPSGIRKGYIRIDASVLRKKSAEMTKTGEDLTGSMAGKNLLIILLDAARNDHMGYNGHKRDTTPHIDTFSKDAFIFENSYSEASYTLASTGTLLTGIPPDFHGVISKFYSSLNRKTITLAKLFGIKEYFTGSITGNPNYGKAFNYDEGFKSYIELFSDHPVVSAEEFIEPFQKMLDEAGQDPFYMYLHIREPHDPFIMPHPYLGKFQNRFRENNDELLKFGKAFGQSYIKEGEETELLKKLYDENLAFGDMVFGKIVSIVKDRGLTDNTLIVFISDHGESIGEHNNIGHGHVLYQQGIRIPVVMRIPGRKGDIFRDQVITSDLVLSITEMFGLEFPYKNNTSAIGLFRGETERRLVIRSINEFDYPGYSILQYPYKLITHFPYRESKTFLFDLSQDPEEKNPLSGKPLIRKSLIFYLFNYLKRAEKGKPRILKPDLRKSDIESLKSLGYL